ncbi:MAG TPA: tRNA pseudouridine(55) synthase TruB [Luteibaculaceae bacterium]|jgi:tRNA pseudouridine55 synthase|nr:tRNA pseudouridine(55) synthase TruB [Luteibaculaceae bacterium]
MKAFSFEAGELLLVDKPYGWTSFDVVNYIKHRVKRITGNKKLKVGHAGTLDPLATGLVMVCTGKMTKSIDQLQAERKIYTGSILLGAESASYDLESKVVRNHAPLPSETELDQARQRLIGEIEQVPPVFSAKKVDGKRAYENARKGIQQVLKANSIVIYDFRFTRIDIPYLDFELVCSKGTYVRSVAHDLGSLLGCGGVLTALRRVQSGDHHVRNALKMSELKIILDKPTL